MRNYLKLGEWNCICDRCGFEFKSGQLKKEWTGLMVCAPCWEPRHPQDLLRVPRETIAPPWTRPEATETFINVGDPLLVEADTDGTLFIVAEDGSPLLTET
jgi:hypothetical protein